MLLLSGDIQLNPGPSMNNTGHSVTTGSATCQGVDTQLNTMTAGLLEPSLVPTGTSDCLSQSSSSAGLNQRKKPGYPPRNQSRAGALLHKKILTQPFGSSTCIITPSPAGENRSKDKKAHSRAALQQKGMKYFQTVNHVKVIWDSKKKLKGVTGGHLNVHTVLY